MCMELCRDLVNQPCVILNPKRVSSGVISDEPYKRPVEPYEKAL